MSPSIAPSLRIPAIFSEYMVIRSDCLNPIWGWSIAEADVHIRFHNQIIKTTADRAGKWRTELPSVPPGGPYELEISSGSERIGFSDVLAGEVWLCSGQSNMEWSVSMAGNSEKEISEANHPQVRLLNIPRLARAEVQSDVIGAWQICSPSTARDFSAVAYYFGREMHQNHKVPVGLINSSWGGTIAEAWTEWEFLKSEPSFADFIRSYEALVQGDPENWERLNDLILDWQKIERYQDPGNRAYFRGWADLEADESEWGNFSAPGLWLEQDMHQQGAVWFRKTIVIPEEWTDHDLILSLGALHDFDVTYFNAERVGGLGKETSEAWKTPRYYRIPASLVHAGKANTIAIRVFVEFDQGGFTGKGPLAIYREGTPAASGISLNGPWKYRAEYAFDAAIPPRIPSQTAGPNCQNSPSNLYNGMIAPLTPYGLTGVIWYQGESNAERAEQYKILFCRMIESWRKAFEKADLPFLFVLLANFQSLQKEPMEQGWGEIREAQLEALKLPHTGMASALDVGEADDIHPKDKQTVGHRLALTARALIHHEPIEYSGPTFDGFQRDESRVRIMFSHVGSGLITRDGEPLRGFGVREAGSSWHWADSVFEGQTVVLSHPDILKIEEVCYGWASNPIGNLSNKEGLPATPFRIQI